MLLMEVGEGQGQHKRGSRAEAVPPPQRRHPHTQNSQQPPSPHPSEHLSYPTPSPHPTPLTHSRVRRLRDVTPTRPLPPCPPPCLPSGGCDAGAAAWRARAATCGGGRVPSRRVRYSSKVRSDRELRPSCGEGGREQGVEVRGQEGGEAACRGWPGCEENVVGPGRV